MLACQLSQCPYQMLLIQGVQSCESQLGHRLLSIEQWYLHAGALSAVSTSRTASRSLLGLMVSAVHRLR